MFDEGAYVFARDIGDRLEEGVSGQQHLTPHLTLVLLGGGSAGQAQELVEDLQRIEGRERTIQTHAQSDTKQCAKRLRKRLLDLQHELHADPVLDQPHHQVGLALEHLVVLPGERVGMLNGEVEVGGWTVGG